MRAARLPILLFLSAHCHALVSAIALDGYSSSAWIDADGLAHSLERSHMTYAHPETVRGALSYVINAPRTVINAPFWAMSHFFAGRRRVAKEEGDDYPYDKAPVIADAAARDAADRRAAADAPFVDAAARELAATYPAWLEVATNPLS